MKPMHVNFAEKRALPRAWIIIVLVALVLAGVWLWQTMKLRDQSQHIAQQLEQARTQLQALQRPVEMQTAVGIENQHPQYRKQAQQAAGILQADLNKAFSALESLKIAGVRLQSLNVNVAQNLVEVEFEFAQLAQASEISEALGGGYSPSPWQLQSTNAQARSAGVGQAVTGVYVGRWQAKLSAL